MRRFYKGDVVYNTDNAIGHWGVETHAVVNATTFEKIDANVFKLFRRPWYNWLKYLYDIVFKIKRMK